MEVKPFKALRFDESIVGDVGRCIAPPYDVIDPAQQEKLYEKSQYNIVRIIKGRTSPQDTPSDNQYTRAAELFDGWLKKGVLKPDNSEMLYGYVQDFTAAGRACQRSGFVALGKLEELGAGVKPHEKTLDSPKADRLNLIRTTAAQFGQIFMLYDDGERIADDIIAKAAGQKPFIDFTDDQSVRHRLSAIADNKDINTIREMMLDKDCIIADGHHRYETALTYYAETQNLASQYRMMTFVNMQNEGLLILPIHRLVGNLKNFGIKKLIADMKEKFEIDEYAFSSDDGKNNAKQRMFGKLKSEFERRRCAFGIYGKDGAFYVAVLAGQSQELDVSVLHKLILEDTLGVGQKALASQSHIEYIKDMGNAIDKSVKKVDDGDGQVVFFMNPTRLEQVKIVTAEGKKMPQKSTFFYPKIFTGLTINKL